MSIICCPECNKEISDKAPSCINCGFPIAQSINGTNQIWEESKEIDKEVNFTISIEKIVTQGVDLIFALYICISDIQFFLLMSLNLTMKLKV